MLGVAPSLSHSLFTTSRYGCVRLGQQTAEAVREHLLRDAGGKLRVLGDGVGGARQARSNFETRRDTPSEGTQLGRRVDGRAVRCRSCGTCRCRRTARARAERIEQRVASGAGRVRAVLLRAPRARWLERRRPSSSSSGMFGGGSGGVVHIRLSEQPLAAQRRRRAAIGRRHGQEADQAGEAGATVVDVLDADRCAAGRQPACRHAVERRQRACTKLMSAFMKSSHERPRAQELVEVEVHLFGRGVGDCVDSRTGKRPARRGGRPRGERPATDRRSS